MSQETLDMVRRELVVIVAGGQPGAACEREGGIHRMGAGDHPPSSGIRWIEAPCREVDEPQPVVCDRLNGSACDLIARIADDENFEIVVCLAQNRLKRALEDDSSPVVGGDTDGHERVRVSAFLPAGIATSTDLPQETTLLGALNRFSDHLESAGHEP
jgi:hypothetical protein